MTCGQLVLSQLISAFPQSFEKAAAEERQRGHGGVGMDEGRVVEETAWWGGRGEG